MVQVLEGLRSLGDDAYPLPLRRLAELADPAAEPRTIVAAVHPARRAFIQHAIVARRELGAPVALLADGARLAGSPLLMQFLLGCCRTASNHAFSAAELKTKVTGKLQKPFQEAVARQVQEDALPPDVGWVLVKNARKLFLLKDLHRGRPASAPLHAPAAPAAFEPAFAEAFDRLDRQAGAHNFVSLVELRRALPVDRAAFDAGLRQLRLAGRYGLSAAEGRHGVTADEQEDGILEDGTLLLYVSRKSP
jgi:hypothetical protein